MITATQPAPRRRAAQTHPNGEHSLSLSSIFATSATDPLASLFTTPTAGSAAATTTNATDPLTSASTSTSVSDQARLLKQLQDLQKSNPAEFQKVTADIAAQLQAAATQAGGSQGAALSSLAAKFTQASQTGSLSPLQSGHHHGGHHHGGGTDSSTSATSSTSSTASSATASAIAAYQQSGGTSAGSALRTQVSSIISQVLTTDTGSAPAATSLLA